MSNKRHAKHSFMLTVLCAVLMIICVKEFIHFSLEIIGLFANDAPLWRLLISVLVIAAAYSAHFHMYNRLR